MQLDGPVTSYDPALGASFQDVVVMWSMYDTLVALDADGTVVPGLATDWDVTADSGLFTIRDGVTCSDGEELTGEVVANSLNRFFAPETAAPFLSNVIGAGNTATATADGQTVTIQLDAPFSGLLSGLTVGYTGIVCSAGTDDPSALTTGSNGTGGFVADSQIAGASYTFTRRDDYEWGPEFAGVPTEGARPATLVMEVVEDENTRANLQTTGDMQIAAYTTDAWERAAGQADWTKTVSNQSDTFLMFNHTEGHPTADPAVRRAIAQALDISRLNDVQSYGAGELITNLGDPTYECYDESLADLYPAYDPDAASKVLEGLSLAVNGTTLLAGGDGNAYVQSALQEAGADVSFQNLNNQQWVSGLFTPLNDWDVTILVFANTSSNLLSGANFFTGSVPPNGQNLSAVSNPEADAALAVARATTGGESCAAMAQYQQLLLENMDVLPLATAPATVVFAPGVTAMVSKGFVRAGTIRIAD
ncbi:ABC transporter substrate-binding protein [Microbacterium sp. CPCC 204701]|uniref:ABC transporter substrate-binding protein n=1 Tax=Microbacterium sp. CPCC 204701 TaxID=2493084 RepID=UPI0013E388A8|nr:ABC transporter substrate-binding protein [Microbacterium sp. CPCC 204701]